jgi:hypothetical protein
MPKSRVRTSGTLKNWSGKKSSLLKKPVGDYPAFFSQSESKALQPMSSLVHLDQLIDLFVRLHPEFTVEQVEGGNMIQPATLTLRNAELGHDFFVSLLFKDKEVEQVFTQWGRKLSVERNPVRLCGRDFVIHVMTMFAYDETGVDAQAETCISLYPLDNYVSHHPDRVIGARV